MKTKINQKDKKIKRNSRESIQNKKFKIRKKFQASYAVKEEKLDWEDIKKEIIGQILNNDYKMIGKESAAAIFIRYKKDYEIISIAEETKNNLIKVEVTGILKDYGQQPDIQVLFL